MSRWAAWTAVGLHTVALLTAQVLYPLRFDELLSMYASRVPDPSLLLLIALNLLAVVGLAALVTGVPVMAILRGSGSRTSAARDT